MTYGLQIMNAAGSTVYKSTDVTWNQVDMVFVNGGGWFSRSYPALANKEVLTAQMLIDPPPLNRRAVAHNISVSGTTVTAGGGSENAYILILMR